MASSPVGFFFFSSRRRHTRGLSDWSSDVCSSDLPPGSEVTGAAAAASDRAKFTVVGGGLGGALMAIFLGRAGYEVEIYEKRRDPRVGQAGEEIGRASCRERG